MNTVRLVSLAKNVIKKIIELCLRVSISQLVLKKLLVAMVEYLYHIQHPLLEYIWMLRLVWELLICIFLSIRLSLLKQHLSLIEQLGTSNFQQKVQYKEILVEFRVMIVQHDIATVIFISLRLNSLSIRLKYHVVHNQHALLDLLLVMGSA